MIDPQTSVQWQEAVDLAYGCLAIDSVRQYGLVTGGPTINVERCDEILKRGRELGYTPREGAAKELVIAINSHPERKHRRARGKNQTGHI